MKDNEQGNDRVWVTLPFHTVHLCLHSQALREPFGKYADNTPIIMWCTENNQLLNVYKTKELFVDFSEKTHKDSHPCLHQWK